MGIFLLDESYPVPGNPGKSAYQIAVDNGYTGTEEEWLASLDGAPGEDGEDGSPGISAYQVAVNNGFIGTESQWLLSLKGADGQSAYQIAVAGGYSGTQAQWIASLKGVQGDPGLSAYQVAVAGGYSGTQAQWLASLVGPQGPAGATGATGAAGVGLNPTIPTSMSVALATAYQPSTTKPVFVSIMIDVAYSLTIAGALADIVELWVGPTSAVATGASGLRVASFRSSLTGIALSIGMGSGDRQQLSAIVPVGYYFAVRRTTGTTATVAESFVQTLF